MYFPAVYLSQIIGNRFNLIGFRIIPIAAG